MVPDLTGLPGGERVAAGLRDHLAGNPHTVEALLVTICHPRLRELGLPIPQDTCLPNAELLLYRRLQQSGVADPYRRYNALLRELVSFRQALEREMYARYRAS